MEGAFRSTALTDPDLRLIETLLWDGAAFPLLSWHLARLSRSAVGFGWPVPALSVAGPPGRAARVRLTLDAGGRIAVAVTEVPPSPAVWRLGLAQARLVSGDPWLGVKSTRRAAYDGARAALGHLDEAVLANERGEVCDGTITTLFFDRGQGMRTPPLSSGLLPGVLRAQMLAAGMVHEEVLAVRDLPRVRLWVGNALRGLMPAVWQP